MFDHRKALTGLLILCSAFYMLSCSKYKRTVSPEISFGPGTYRGVYTGIKNWNQMYEREVSDTMIFTFTDNGVLFMRKDTTAIDPKNICEVNADYTYYDEKDTVEFDITYIFPTVTCDPDLLPNGAFKSFLGASHTIILESRLFEENLYRKFELWISQD